MKDRNDTTGVKFIKFHDNLHYVQGIDGHGSVQNWDTGRPESNAISHYKRNVKLTQRRQQNLSLQISIKHYEDLIMREASIAVKMDKKSDSSSRKMTSRLSGSKYKMTHHHDEDANGDVSDNIQIEWGGRIRPSFFPQKICLAMCKKLFVAERGVYHLDSSSIVTGRTEYIDANGNRYRAHPNYNGKPWFDWCYVRWDAYTDEYPCKIICFLDMSENCKFITDDDDEEETDDQYLDNREWVVIHSCEDMDEDDLETLYSPNIAKRYKLPDCLRIVPVSSIVRPAYCIPDKKYDSHWEIENVVSINCVRSWSSKFLEE